MNQSKPDPDKYFQVLPSNFKEYVVKNILDYLPLESKFEARQQVESLWKDYRGRDKDVLDVLGLAAKKGFPVFSKYASLFRENVLAFAEVAWQDRSDPKQMRVRHLEEILENVRTQLGQGRRAGTQTVIMRSPLAQDQRPTSVSFPVKNEKPKENK